VFGLSHNGNAWCQILDADSGDVNQIFESYIPNGSGSSESDQYAFGGNFNANVKKSNIHGYPIFYISGNGSGNGSGDGYGDDYGGGSGGGHGGG
jgi:hypothetical protein